MIGALLIVVYHWSVVGRGLPDHDQQRSNHHAPHHHTIQINQPTRCNSFTGLLIDVYVWLNMFRAPPSIIRSVQLHLPLERGDWSVVGRGLVDHDQQRSNGKCSCTLLIMDGKAPETYWATHKRLLINLWNCCILLVDLFKSCDDARTCERQTTIDVEIICT